MGVWIVRMMGNYEEHVMFVLAAIGGLKVAWMLIDMLMGLFARGVAISKKTGEWAVVTGASEGIGAAYCEVLAKKGLNIVLISRSAEKLKSTEDKLKEKFPAINTRCIPFDLGKLDQSSVNESSIKELLSLDVGVLVNNVGISYEYPEYFAELSDDRVQKLIDLNVVATTWMTKFILPGMLERKRGVILSISSAAGIMTAGSPLLAMYSGTKAFVERFSTSLAGEYSKSGVTIQTHTPYFVSSSMSKMKPNWMCPKPTVFAKASVAKIGNGVSNVIPYWVHALQHYVIESAPIWLVQKLVGSMHVGIKKRALKKKARQAEEESKKSQ